MNPVPDRSWFRGKSWFWIPIAPLVTLDLWSKWAVFGFLGASHPEAASHHREHFVFDGPIGFSLVALRNRGTIWGLGRDSGDFFNFALIGLRVVALGLLVYFASRTPPARRFKQLVLGLIMAGAIGNLWDNLTESDRAVRDFLKFFWRDADGKEAGMFPAFNVADSCICVGAISLAVVLWLEDRAIARAQRRHPAGVAGRP